MDRQEENETVFFPQIVLSEPVSFSALPSLYPLRGFRLDRILATNLEIFHEGLFETVDIGKVLTLVLIRGPQ